MGTEHKPTALQPLNALIEARAAAHAASDTPWLQSLRGAAREHLNTMGLPGRRWESWHYSPAEAWLQRFHEQQGLAPIEAGAVAASNFESPNRLLFSHGLLIEQHLDPALTLLPLTQLDVDKHATVIDWLSQYPHKDSLASAATALAPESWVLIVPANTQIAAPIVVSHFTTQSGAQFAQLIVWMETGAGATLVEFFDGNGNQPANYSALQIAHMQIRVGDNARLTMARLNCDGGDTQHLGIIEGDVQRDAQLRLQLLRGGTPGSANQKQRNGVYIRLQGSGAEFTARGAFAAAGTQHIDYHFTVDHNADHGRCDMQMQGIARDQSHGIVNGRIYIAKDTRANDGHFTSHNLLISDTAEIDAKPELEIYADDVRCDHGATVGQFDEDQLFYLATRGIDRSEAVALLTEGFLKAGLLDIGDEALNNFVQQQLLTSIQMASGADA